MQILQEENAALLAQHQQLQTTCHTQEVTLTRQEQVLKTTQEEKIQWGTNHQALLEKMTASETHAQNLQQRLEHTEGKLEATQVALQMAHQSTHQLQETLQNVTHHHTELLKQWGLNPTQSEEVKVNKEP